MSQDQIGGAHVQEPGVCSSLAAYIHPRLKRGLPPEVVRNAAIRAFVEIFDEVSPSKEFTAQYRKEVTLAADQAIAAYRAAQEREQAQEKESAPNA